MIRHGMTPKLVRIILQMLNELIRNKFWNDKPSHLDVRMAKPLMLEPSQF